MEPRNMAKIFWIFTGEVVYQEDLGGPFAEPLSGETARAAAGLGAIDGAELGAGAAAGLGALEGVEAGVMGGPVGMLAGAAIGAAGSAALASLAFRDREPTEQQAHFMDLRSLNGGNASVRPIRPHCVFDQRDALRQRQDIPTYYRLDEDDAPGPAITEPGCQ